MIVVGPLGWTKVVCCSFADCNRRTDSRQ